jgi:hypothetical protein
LQELLTVLNDKPIAERGVVTIAIGQTKYIEQAKDLGRSLIVNSPRISRGIITDSDDRELLDLFPIRGFLPEEARRCRGVEVKLYLDQMTPFKETLFLDADTLVFSELENIWETFRTTSFGPFGSCVSELPAYWLSDSKEFAAKHRLDYFVSFNGGLYYFQSDAASRSVFHTARQLAVRYDELGFTRLNGGVNEEPLFSVAMAIHGIKPVIADGEPIMSVVRTSLEIDVLQGKRILITPEGIRTQPHVLHFCGRMA